MTDTFAFGGKSVTNMTMGYATSISQGITNGIMGIGFGSDESIVSEGGQQYPNIMDVLLQQGLIQSRSYSLFLEDLG